MKLTESTLRRIVRKMITEATLRIIAREEILSEKDESKHHPNYKAPEGSKRDNQLDQTKEDLASGDPERVQRAYARRERMEKKEREKPGFENKPRPDSKKESHDLSAADEEMLRELIREALSKKTKATLRKKAKKRGLTPGSVEAEYKKGLAAWASSGSRKGMSQHQWAMARVNSANPSKNWAVVKKSKAKRTKARITEEQLRRIIRYADVLPGDVEDAEFTGANLKNADITGATVSESIVYAKNTEGLTCDEYVTEMLKTGRTELSPAAPRNEVFKSRKQRI